MMESNSGPVNGLMELATGGKSTWVAQMGRSSRAPRFDSRYSQNFSILIPQFCFVALKDFFLFLK